MIAILIELGMLEDAKRDRNNCFKSRGEDEIVRTLVIGDIHGKFYALMFLY